MHPLGEIDETPTTCLSRPGPVQRHGDRSPRGDAGHQWPSFRARRDESPGWPQDQAHGGQQRRLARGIRELRAQSREGRCRQGPHRRVRRTAAAGQVSVLWRVPHGYRQGHVDRRITTPEPSMFATAILVFREVLEAALIISIVCAATRGLPGRGRWVSAGIGLGVAGAVLLALGADQVANAAEGMGQELLNAGVLAAAVLMLAWHAIWMSRHGRELALQMKSVGAAVVEG